MFTELNINQNKQEKEIDFNAMHDDCIVDVSLELPPPPVALSLGTYTYKGYQYPIPFGTYGNFSCLVGASKSMKTFSYGKSTNKVQKSTYFQKIIKNSPTPQLWWPLSSSSEGVRR